MSAMPRLVKAGDRERERGPDLSAFTDKQRAQLLAWEQARRESRRQALRDMVQGFGAIMAALRRLADDHKE